MAAGCGTGGRGAEEATAAAFRGLEPLWLLDSGTHARLETILSGKDGLAVAALPERRRPAGGGRRRGRSLLELEFEKVTGLRDLGFTFSDAEVDAEEENRAAASAPAAPRDAPSSSAPPEEAAAAAAT